MKIKTASIVLLLLLLTPFFLSAAPVPAYTFSSQTYGPFQKYEDNQNIVIRVTGSSYIRQEIFCLLKILDQDNNSLSQSKSNNVTISKNETGILNVTLLTHAHLDEDGMNIEFCLIDANNLNLLKILNFSIFPLSAKEYNPIDYSEKSIRENPTCFRFNNSQVDTYQEEYVFDEFVDYFLFDTYYQLSLKQFRFTYHYVNFLTYQKAYIILPDDVPSFDYLPADETGQKIIPLSLIKNAETYYLSFPDIMYVNPLSLDMSLKEERGFVATSYFYLPINQMDIFENTNFSFAIEGLGANKSRFVWTVNFTVTKSLIGPCSSSDYCVIGGVSQ